MRTAILFCLFAVFGYTATAQFSIQPQLGFENAGTKVDYNNLSSFSPGNAKVSPQVALRLDYKFKQMHGPYIGLATSRSIVEYRFSDPETGRDNYTAARGNTQIRMEAGYQLSTKPIYIKSKATASSLLKSRCQKSSDYYSAMTSTNHCQKKTQDYSVNSPKGHCQKYMEGSSCGRKSEAAKKAVSNKGSWVRLLPSLGIAYMPSVPSTEIENKSVGGQSLYQYNAGNWRTAITGGLGFQFGRNTHQGFIVSLNYLKGMGSGLDTKSLTTMEGNKLTNTSLSSTASSWNLRMGIPISLSKKKPLAKEQVIVTEKIYKAENKCGQYKTLYKSRCNRTLPEQ
jgi:hypothetical protein